MVYRKYTKVNIYIFFCYNKDLNDIMLYHNIICLEQYSWRTSIAHRIRNLLRRTSEHIAIIYFRIFAAFCLFLNLKEYDKYLSYHTYSYIDYITMHFPNMFSLDNDMILVHRKLGQKLITLENCINFHNM